MRSIRSGLIMIIIIILCGCQNNYQQQADDIDSLKIQVNVLNNTLSQLQSDIISMQVNQEFKQIGFFKPASVGAGYENIQSAGYIFPVSLNSLTQSPGGYEADFEIGNPYACLFRDVTVNVAWGPNWNGEISQDKNSITIPALPMASWTSFKIFLSPADDSTIQTIAVKISYSTIGLSNTIYN